MEKVFFKHLFDYMKDHTVLCKFQSGFQQGDSTVNHLAKIKNTNR